MANTGIKGIVGLGVAMTAMGAAGVAAGAVAAAAVGGMTAAIGGGLIYFAAKNQEVKDSFTGLKDHVTTTMSNLTAPLTEPLKQFAQQSKGAFDALGPSISNIVGLLGPMITQIGEKLTPLAQRLGPMLESAFSSGQGPLMALIDGLNPVIDGFKGFFDALNKPEVAEFVRLFMEEIGQLLPLIGQLLADLTPIGNESLPMISDAFSSVSDVITGILVPAFAAIGGFLSEHPGLVNALAIAFIAFKVATVGAGIAMAVFEGIMTVAKVAMGLYTAAQWLANASLYGFPLVWIIAAVLAVIAIIVLLIANWDHVTAFLSTCWEWIKQTAITVWNAIRDFFVNLWNSIKDKAVEIFNGIKDWIGNTWNSIKETASNVWNSIKETISNAWNNITNTVLSKLVELKNWVVNKFNEIIGFITGLPGRFVQMGRDLIQGLINGAGAMAGALVGKVRDLASSAINAIKSVFGIGSPSKVFRQIGVWTGEGLVLGFGDEQKHVAQAVEALGDAGLNVLSDKPFFKAGLSFGEQLAEGIQAAGSQVSRASAGLSGLVSAGVGGMDARLQLDAAVLTNGGGGNTFQVSVQAGISSPEETGRAVVEAINKFEQLNGTRWRDS